MAVTRPVDILIRLRKITDGMEQGMSKSVILNEVKGIFAAEAAVNFGCGSHVQRIMNLLDNPSYGWSDIWEEILIVEEFMQTDVYGFREHSWQIF